MPIPPEESPDAAAARFVVVVGAAVRCVVALAAPVPPAAAVVVPEPFVPEVSVPEPAAPDGVVVVVVPDASARKLVRNDDRSE